MQLSEIKTAEQAKALAFDAIQRIEIEQNNLRALQVRIQDLQNAEALGGNKSDLAQIVNDATAEQTAPVEDATKGK